MVSYTKVSIIVIKKAWTYSYTYRAVYMGISPNIYKKALSHLYIKTFSIFLNLGLIYFLFL